MVSGEKTLYPMLGVGAFFVMFWVGFVVGYELGLNCGLFLLNAFFFACSGAWLVARMETANSCPRPSRQSESRSDSEPGRRPLPAFPHPFASGSR